MATKRRPKGGRRSVAKKTRARAKATARPRSRPKAKARKSPAGAKVRRRKPARPKAGAAGARPTAPSIAPARFLEAPPPAPVDDLRTKVVRELEASGYSPPDPVVVDVVTAVAKGYREGRASAPPWLRFEVDSALAEGWVERYETGDRSPGPDRTMHRSQVRWTVVFNLEQLGLASTTGDAERDVIASLCLGAWNPATMTQAERDGAASFIVRWYRDGR